MNQVCITQQKKLVWTKKKHQPFLSMSLFINHMRGAHCIVVQVIDNVCLFEGRAGTWMNGRWMHLHSLVRVSTTIYPGCIALLAMDFISLIFVGGEHKHNSPRWYKSQVLGTCVDGEIADDNRCQSI